MSQSKKFLILTIDEVREQLVQFYANVLVNDRANVVELLRVGQLHSFIPDIANLSIDQLLNLYAELCVGDELIVNSDYDILVAEVSNDKGIVTKYEFLADKQQGISPPPTLQDLSQAIHIVAVPVEIRELG